MCVSARIAESSWRAIASRGARLDVGFNLLVLAVHVQRQLAQRANQSIANARQKQVLLTRDQASRVQRPGLSLAAALVGAGNHQ